MQLLDAVNDCLRAVVLSPINSLDSGAPEATKASAKVLQVSEIVQESGWSANTDYKVLLPLDVNGFCWLPSNTLDADASNYNPSLDRISIRVDPASGNKRLWDVKNLTFVFTQTGGIKVDLIYLYDFEDLPSTLQRYIAARAAREYQEENLASGTVDKFTSRREQDCLTALISAEAEEEDWNVLTDNESVASITYRYDPFYGV